MTSLRVRGVRSFRRGAIEAAVLAAVVAYGSVALAAPTEKGKGKHEGAQGPAPVSSGANVSEAGATGPTTRDRGDRAGSGEATEAEERPVHLGAEVVIGFGKTDVVNQDLPGSLATVPSNSIQQAKMTSYSFLLSGGVELGHGVGLGLRLPFSSGEFTVPGHSSRGTAALGNLELEGEYERELSEKLTLAIGLGVALPTAQGDELPEADVVNGLGAGADLNAYDRFALQRAAAASRGYEDNALFEPKHLGIIPKIGLSFRSGKLALQPYVKLENLIATTSQPHGYVGELVAGARLAYAIVPQLDAGVRVWTNVPLANAGFDTVGVVEPELRGHFGAVTPVVGVILPFAGTLTDPYFAGVRIGIAASF